MGEEMYMPAASRKRVYVGAWQKGHMCGKGAMTWPDGSRYEGEYKNDFRHGQGTLTWPDGRKYEGQWANGKQESYVISLWGGFSVGRWRRRNDRQPGQCDEESLAQWLTDRGLIPGGSVPGTGVTCRTWKSSSVRLVSHHVLGCSGCRCWNTQM
eukprot:s1374_g6.t1